VGEGGNFSAIRPGTSDKSRGQGGWHFLGTTPEALGHPPFVPFRNFFPGFRGALSRVNWVPRVFKFTELFDFPHKGNPGDFGPPWGFEPTRHRGAALLGATLSWGNRTPGEGTYFGAPKGGG